MTDDSNELSRSRFLRLMAGGAAALAVGGVAGPPQAHEGRMAKRKIPSSGEGLPVVGLGTWQTFDVGLDAEQRGRLTEVLRLLFAAGGSVIDSSPMYGRSEAVVGELLDEMGARERAFLATKVWTRGRDAGIDQMEQSFARFRTDPIDLMQIHNLVDWKTHLVTLRRWKEEGRIRYVGITHYTRSAYDDLAAVMSSEPLDFVQFNYSLAARESERRLLPLAADRGIAVLVNRPYQKGALFRAVRGRPMPDIAAEFGAATWGQFFLKFVLSHPAVSCVIPGTSKPKHMADNVGAGMGRLPDATERARMVAFWEGV